MSPDAVIATVEGNKLTAADIQNMLDNAPPSFSQYFHQDPATAIAQLYVLRHLASEAEKLKLYDETPWKQQLAIQRENLLANAMTTYDRNHYEVKAEAIQEFYEKNKANFEQVKLKDIKISYKPGLQSTGTSIEAIEQAAKDAVNAAHSATDRSEADAKKLADDLVAKLRGGADFSKTVAEFSEDQETKESGGEFGVVKFNSSYPADLKKAALSLKTGDVSEPIKVGNVAFYILKAENRSFQPMVEVSEPIIQELRAEHLQQELKDLQTRFKPTIENPQLLMQFTSTPVTQGPPKK
jgi:parvulin-like peptidyl-prolyl isomerase